MMPDEGMKGVHMNCIHAKTVYTGESILSDVYLVFVGSRVVAISKTKHGKLPDKYEVVNTDFVDPRSHISMQRADEPTDGVNPFLLNPIKPFDLRC